MAVIIAYSAGECHCLVSVSSIYCQTGWSSYCQNLFVFQCPLEIQYLENFRNLKKEGKNE